jgi:hypothetical protein
MRCEFLKSKDELEKCSSDIDQYGYIHHGVVRCKDWDLMHVLPYLECGNLLDMGSSGSY